MTAALLNLAASGTSFWVLFAGVALVSLGSTGLSIWLVWRRALEKHPQEYAFRAIARHLRVSRREREAIRAVATACGKPPVGLLLCPSALDEETKRWAAEHQADPRAPMVRDVLSRLAA